MASPLLLILGRRLRLVRRVAGQPATTPLERRVTLLTAVAVTSAIVVAGVVGYASARVAIYRQLDLALESMGTRLVQLLPADIDQIPTVAGKNTGLGYFTLEVVAADGTVVFANQNALPPDADERAVAAAGVGSAARTAEVGGVRYRVVAMAIPQLPGHALILTRPLSAGQAILRSLTVTFLVLSLLGLLASAALGRLVAWSGLSPVRQLARAFERVSVTNELVPLPTQRHDDLSRLVTSFNQMIASLSTSRERQRRLIADAGHELRTPLTSLRTNSELLGMDQLRPVLSDADRAQVIREITRQTTELSELITDLVQLARDDTTGFAPERVDLADVVEAAVARARLGGPSVDFVVQLQSYVLMAEPADLERAIGNVLDNAVRHSGFGGRVEVLLAGGTLTIRDHGDGIAAADLPLVFDRFFRAEKSRSSPGTGLGLSIAAQTVGRNGGTIHAANDAAGGAVFTIGFDVPDLAGDPAPAP